MTSNHNEEVRFSHTMKRTSAWKSSLFSQYDISWKIDNIDSNTGDMVAADLSELTYEAKSSKDDAW